jgi:hypothetical protein
MKAIVNWLFDPYVHILVIALVAVRLATMGASDDARDAGSPSIELSHSAYCAQLHAASECCAPFAARTFHEHDSVPQPNILSH